MENTSTRRQRRRIQKGRGRRAFIAAEGRAVLRGAAVLRPEATAMPMVTSASVSALWFAVDFRIGIGLLGFHGKCKPNMGRMQPLS
jgi:hypothetical protein